jgi:hypothetical protein
MRYSKLHNMEIHNLLSCFNVIRRMKWRRTRWTNHEVHIGEQVSTYRVSENLSDRKWPITRLIRRLEVNIKMYPREICWRMWIGFMWLMSLRNKSVLVPFDESEPVSNLHISFLKRIFRNKYWLLLFDFLLFRRDFNFNFNAVPRPITLYDSYVKKILRQRNKNDCYWSP